MPGAGTLITGRGDVTTLVPGSVRVDDDGFGWATPTFVVTSVDALVSAGDDLLDEAFGPLSVIVEYDDAAALPELAERLFPGNLTATVHAASGEDTPELAALVRSLMRVSRPGAVRRLADRSVGDRGDATRRPVPGRHRRLDIGRHGSDRPVPAVGRLPERAAVAAAAAAAR